MSAYVVFTTAMLEPSLMAAAIEEACRQLRMQYESESGNTLTLVDWHGQKRPERVQFCIRRRYLSHLSNDLGFQQASTADEGYAIIQSDYDLHSGRAAEVVSLVKKVYQAKKVIRDARLAGYLPESEDLIPNSDGNIIIRVRPQAMAQVVRP